MLEFLILYFIGVPLFFMLLAALAAVLSQLVPLALFAIAVAMVNGFLGWLTGSEEVAFWIMAVTGAVWFVWLIVLDGPGWPSPKGPEAPPERVEPVMTRAH
jgi:hypothetical protein